MKTETTTLKEKVITAADFIRDRMPIQPAVGVILGTGLGDLANQVSPSLILKYSEIPFFPESTVKFHAGRLVIGALRQKPLFIMQGRFHYYENYSMQEITLPVRVMHLLGIKTLLITNAAGGIRPHLTAGTFALISDHLNLMGANPLAGHYDEFFGERFPDMSEPYNRKLRKTASAIAAKLNINLPEIIYAAVSGPSFETPAEIRMLQALGADAVGMSVVPEVLVARQLGMQVLALTAITDQALPDSMASISHEQVSQMAAAMTPQFIQLAETIVAHLES
ncbi:MAG: purine-nucleoside phosphorylase [Calditrichaeota bacterium]|nr:MAG: purine-nucleoside phosphorylase [Calditrichota bacterium]